MRVKIEMTMSGNGFLDLLRRVPKGIAELLRANATITEPGKTEEETKEAKYHLLLSADTLIVAKKR
jgi:hypothetical protein